MDNIITPWIESAVRSMIASSRREAANVTATLQRAEQVRITASFENISDKSFKLHDVNVNDETQGDIPDEVSEFLVPGIHSERQL